MSKFKRIVSFGCSFARAAIEEEDITRKNFNPECLTQYHNSYTRFLAERLDIDYINYGTGGASLYHAFDCFYNHIKLNPSHKEDTLFLWGLTLADRFDFPDNEAHCKIVPAKHNNNMLDGEEYKLYKRSKKKLPFSYSDLKSHSTWFGGSTEEEIAPVAEFYTRYVYEKEGFIDNFLMHVDVYQKYISTITDNIVYINNMELHCGYVPNTLRFPDGSTSWRFYIKSYDSGYSATHPNTADHRILADLLYDHIQEKFPKKIP